MSKLTKSKIDRIATIWDTAMTLNPHKDAGGVYSNQDYSFSVNSYPRVGLPSVYFTDWSRLGNFEKARDNFFSEIKKCFSIRLHNTTDWYYEVGHFKHSLSQDFIPRCKDVDSEKSLRSLVSLAFDVHRKLSGFIGNTYYLDISHKCLEVTSNYGFKWSSPMCETYAESAKKTLDAVYSKLWELERTYREDMFFVRWVLESVERLSKVG